MRELGLALFLLTDAPCWFGDGCVYACHCNNGAACDRDTGHCPNGCDDGGALGPWFAWGGPGCQVGE